MKHLNDSQCLTTKKNTAGKVVVKAKQSDWLKTRSTILGCCTCCIFGGDIISVKTPCQVSLLCLHLYAVVDKIISLSLDTQQATQVFDCTSRQTLSLLGIRKRGDKKVKWSKTGWSSYRGSNLWPTVWRHALARNSS